MFPLRLVTLELGEQYAEGREIWLWENPLFVMGGRVSKAERCMGDSGHERADGRVGNSPGMNRTEGGVFAETAALVRSALGRLADGGTLGEAEAEGVFEGLLRGELDAAQIGALLGMIQSRAGGATVDEVVGAARAMRRHVSAVPFAPAAGEVVLDTCGTGGAGKTFNISTAAALVIAGAAADRSVAGVERVVVAKHGNRSRTGRGSAEVLAALGVNVDATPEAQARCLRTCGVCFCFAIHHHPAMRHAAGPRRSLGFPTIFNVLGPLTNPAGAGHQLLGVYRAELVETVASALQRLGTAGAVVVHGDGMDEATTTGATLVAEVDGRGVRTRWMEAAEAGLSRATRGALEARDVGHAAELVAAVVEGRGPIAAREIVLLNAGLGLVAARAARDVRDGVERARASIESGSAGRVLAGLVAASRA